VRSRKKEQLRQRTLYGQKKKREPSSSSSSGTPLPPGQYVVKKWIILDLGLRPSREMYDPWQKPDTWRLVVSGLVANPVQLTLADLRQLGLRRYEGIDFHCATGWSALQLGFEGVPFRALLDHVRPDERWVCLYQVSADGYTTNCHRQDIENDPNAFIAIGDGRGEILSEEHGGIRLIVPSLYGGKSAKFLSEIWLLDYHRKGFWEDRGCHDRGRVDQEERFVKNAQEMWGRWIFFLNSARCLCGERAYVFLIQLLGKMVGDVDVGDGSKTKKWFKIALLLLGFFLVSFVVGIYFLFFR